MKHFSDEQHFGFVRILIHWVIACIVVGLFASGLWMTELDYYSSWYRVGPDLHKSFGVTLTILIVCSILLKRLTIQPRALSTHSRVVVLLSRLAQFYFYSVILLMFLTGYLITTSSGQDLLVFGLFGIPSILQRDNLEDLAGDIHEWSAWSVICVAVIHTLAALKHHFIDRDITLLRMITNKFERRSP